MPAPDGLPEFLWIALTIMAALMLALRTAAQKHLGRTLSTDAATYVRYLFALPLAGVWMLGLHQGFDLSFVPVTGEALFFIALIAAGQIFGTRFLLLALHARNFAVGVAWSKTDVVQAAMFEIVVLGSAISWGGGAAILLATLGVVMMSMKGEGHPLRLLLAGMREKSALYGILSGTSFAVAGVAVRGANLSLAGGEPFMPAAQALTITLALQVVALGAWLVWRERQSFGAIARAWRVGLFAGVTGTLASIGWFVAMALESVAHVRTLGLVELLFSFLIARVLFHERATPREIAGVMVLSAGIALLMLGR
ncbi:MAG TPA: DMT family transporter [Micropepsaceae bacterium]|nr:DMT family transporter [Micropepsaceae bacterium]